MLTVMFEETKTRDLKEVKSLNFYHFRDLIAIPGMNDLIFRRRLFETCWTSRKQALHLIKGFLASGKQFSTELTAKEASVQRDHILLFGTKKENQDLYLDEARYLPQNQHHKHHEIYAQIVRMIRNLGPNASDEDPDLSELYAHLDRNTPIVTEKWARYWLEDEDEVACGPSFYAPSSDAAQQFCNFVEKAHGSDTISGKEVGLCAMGFLADPYLSTQKCNEQQAQLYQEIKRIMSEVKDPKIIELSEVVDEAMSYPSPSPLG